MLCRFTLSSIVDFLSGEGREDCFFGVKERGGRRREGALFIQNENAAHREGDEMG